jgi:glycerophosphoryl diester phosphodiesterase
LEFALDGLLADELDLLFHPIMAQASAMKTCGNRFMKLFIAVASLSLFAGSMFAVDIVAHRGASWDAPENTLAAMKLGWEQGADGVELDLHLSKDGKIVVIHDFDTKRIGGVDKKVVDQNFAELRKLDMGSWKGARWAGEPVPIFDEVLATVPEGKRIFIEIKVGPEILPELGRALKRSGKKPEQLVIISFRYDTMEASKKRFPKLQHYWLHSYRKDKETGEYPKIEDLIASAKAANLDGLNLNHNFPADKEFGQKVKDAGLGLYVWTVNDVEIAKRWIAAGVEGITTDRPAWLREQLK